MVFPKGANFLEFAADHLDRLLGKSCIDRFVHKGCMTQHSHANSSHQPKSRSHRRGPDKDRNANDEQACVELRCCQAREAELEFTAIELPDRKEAYSHEDHIEEEGKVCKQAVDREHHGDGKVIALEVAQVPVDSTLDFAEIGGFGEAFDVKEFIDGFEVCEARGQGLCANSFETGLKVQARGESLDGDADSRHGCWILKWDRGEGKI